MYSIEKLRQGLLTISVSDPSTHALYKHFKRKDHASCIELIYVCVLCCCFLEYRIFSEFNLVYLQLTKNLYLQFQ